MLGRGWGGRVYEFEYGVAKRAGRLLASSHLKQGWRAICLQTTTPIRFRFESFLIATSKKCFWGEFESAFRHSMYKANGKKVKFRVAYDEKSILFWVFDKPDFPLHDIIRCQYELWEEATKDMTTVF
jgi:hypothetical protein